MRGRFISADFWDDGLFDDWPMEKVFCFMGLWAAASDYGVLPTNDPGRLRNEIFPGRPCVTREMVGAWCQEMESVGLLIPFDADGKHWWVIKDFEKRQPLRRKSACGRPMPPTTDNVRHCLSTADNVRPEQENVRTIEQQPPVVPLGTTAVVVAAEDDCPETDPELAAACQSYESEIGILSPVIAEEIKAELADGTPLEWIQRAIRQAVRQNKRKWSYVRAILKAWQAQGHMDTGPPKRRGPPVVVDEPESPPFEQVFGST